MATDYRLSPALTARLLGLTLLGGALLVALATLLIAITDVHTIVLLVPVVLVVVTLVAVMAWSSSWAVRLTDDGYQVRRLRNAGTTAARWREVEDLVATTVEGVPCIALRLRDGRSTTLPVGALHVDPTELGRTIGEHLNRAHGLRKLG